jgi:hypothetical protein
MREAGPQQQLIAEMDTAAARINAAIDGLSDEQASRPAGDGWSVKDQLTHITFWHEMRFFEVSRIARGGRASFPGTDEKGVEHINEQMAANRRRHPLSQVVADLGFAREMVRQAVLAAPEDRLVPSVFEEIGPNGAAHEMSHADLIDAWRAKEGL